MNSKQVPISIAARLIYHLGEQLISDELVALLELIKNAYDADATKCTVTVDSKAVTPYGLGEIIITDNGNGMLPHTVTKDFLRLATNYKKENKVSPYYKRRALGEKGLGRLSFQRLGKYIIVTTTARIDRLKMTEDDYQSFLVDGNNCIEITMNWDGFSDEANITDVYATVVEQRKDAPLQYGTIITIQGIRNNNFWHLNDEKRHRLHEEILALINPFAPEQVGDTFNLQLNVNGEEFRIDSIEEKILEKLCDVSAHIKFRKGTTKIINSKGNEEDIETRDITIDADFKDRYIQQLKKNYLEKCSKDKFELIEESFTPSSYYHRTVKANLRNAEEWSQKFQIDIDNVQEINGTPAVDFEFDCNLYIVDKANANRSDISQNILKENIFIQTNFKKIGDLWDQISGVYMYRDKFRILPYGKSDWLGLTRRSQKGKATILKQGNVCGYVHLFGQECEHIREQTNRQGILEDEYGSNFLMLLDRVVIGQLFRWDTSLRGLFITPKPKPNHFYASPGDNFIFKKIVQAKEVYEKQDKALTSTIHSAETDTNSLKQSSFFDTESLEKQVIALASSAKSFQEASLALQKDYQQKLSLANAKLSEYNDIIPLLGQSIIVETTTHELSRIYSKLSDASFRLEKLTKNQIVDRSDLLPVFLTIKTQISELNLQLNHILPTQRYKLKDTKNIDIISFLEDNYVIGGAIGKRLHDNGISCKITGKTFIIKASMGNLIVVFDNLIINSEYWLKKSLSPLKEITMDCDNGTIIFWDSGPGISKDIENSLFEPFQSLKENGRGLGLYIVQELLALYNYSIELLPERNIYGNRYKFAIHFFEE